MMPIDETRLIVDINDEKFDKLMKMGELMEVPCIVTDHGEVLSYDDHPAEEYRKICILNDEEEERINNPILRAQPNDNVNSLYRDYRREKANQDVNDTNMPIGELPKFVELANVNDEPENIDKDFLKAQLSVKHQSILRNVLALVSSVAVAITFLLEKLGVI